MLELWLLVSALVAGVFLAVVAVGIHSRRVLLARARREWGTSSPRDYSRVGLLEAHRSRVAAEGTDSLDDRTWADLNLDAVFAACDRTESTLGQQALYHRIRSANTNDQEALDAFERLTSHLAGNIPCRERAQVSLGPLQDSWGYDLWWLARGLPIERRPWHLVFPLLSFTALALVAAAIQAPALWPLAIACMAVNVVTRLTLDSTLSTIAGAFRQCAPVIKAARGLRGSVPAEPLSLTAPLVEDLPRLDKLHAVSAWVSGNPFMLPTASSMVASALNDVITVAYDYLNFAFLLDANALYFGLGELQRQTAPLLRVLGAVGHVDAALSVASYRSGLLQWARPTHLEPGVTATLTNVVHPLVEDAVANSVELTPAHGILVTGSNMSGKSTFLRTVGVNVVMAQSLHTCLAERYAAPHFKVRSCIGRADDLLAGKSYYRVEAETLLGFVTESQSPHACLFLLDELFRGTNAVERIAAAKAVLEELIADHDDAPSTHVVIAATHDGELVDLLGQRHAPVHFGSTLTDGGLDFDYRLTPGPATSRNALALLEQYGAPATLLARANETARALDWQRADSSSRPVD